MEDQSLLYQNPQEVQNYLNELAIAVCVKGEQLEKYERTVIKGYGKDLYVNMQQFAEELKHSVERGRYTNTSMNMGQARNIEQNHEAVSALWDDIIWQMQSDSSNNAESNNNQEVAPDTK